MDKVAFLIQGFVGHYSAATLAGSWNAPPGTVVVGNCREGVRSSSASREANFGLDAEFYPAAILGQVIGPNGRVWHSDAKAPEILRPSTTRQEQPAHPQPPQCAGHNDSGSRNNGMRKFSDGRSGVANFG